MLEAICELTNARPHMRTKARFGPGELRAYHEGYYWGCIMSLRVADLAVERFKLTTQTIRQLRKAKRSA
jgi:hypothetical protein